MTELLYLCRKAKGVKAQHPRALATCPLVLTAVQPRCNTRQQVQLHFKPLLMQNGYGCLECPRASAALSRLAEVSQREAVKVTGGSAQAQTPFLYSGQSALMKVLGVKMSLFACSSHKPQTPASVQWEIEQENVGYWVKFRNTNVPAFLLCCTTLT